MGLKIVTSPIETILSVFFFSSVVMRRKFDRRGGGEQSNIEKYNLLLNLHLWLKSSQETLQTS